MERIDKITECWQRKVNAKECSEACNLRIRDVRRSYSILASIERGRRSDLNKEAYKMAKAECNAKGVDQSNYPLDALKQWGLANLDRSMEIGFTEYASKG